MRKIGRVQLAILIVVVLGGVVWPSAANFYTDWLWFVEVGYQQVFTTSLLTRLGLGAVVAIMTFLMLFVNFRIALRRFDEPYLVLGVSPADGSPVVIQRGGVVWLVTLASALGALAAGVYGSSQWLDWLKYSNAVPFGVTDPILGHDVAFYVFSLPWLTFLRGLALAVFVLAAAGSVFIYLLPERAAGERSNPMAALRVGLTHLSILAAGILALLAAGAWLDRAGLLLSPGGIIHGATYADVSAAMPALLFLVFAASAGAVLALANTILGKMWPLAAALGLYAVVAIGGNVYTAAVQRLLVIPNEQVKETPYLLYNIEATRRAFALDRVEERQLSGDATLTREDIDRNASTLANVRLWDKQPLLDTFGQIQEIRTYYDFVSVDNDRYVIDGQYRQVMLSVRELNTDSLPSRTWVNERLTFTHGYGVTLGPVNEVTPEGLPVLFIKNLPPESSVDLELTEPSVYFGEMSNDHVFVGTQAEEFHYPRGDDNVFKSYDGSGGVPIGSLWRKLVFASRFRSLKLLLSNDVNQDSRVLFRRRIMERVSAIAPFLVFDRDPYAVIADGRIHWILDAYTVTGQYPYSTRADGGVNYIRNSVKAVVDAYHGTTTFYLADSEDPIAATIARIFPGVFKPLAEMPEALKAHLRYPEGIFTLQSTMFATYHMTNPGVFYNKEDQWEVPVIGSGSVAASMEPYYTIMRLPGEKDSEFIQMLPFTPRRKDNLAAWMVARSDFEHYGRLLVFQFPKQKVVFGPRQVVARISQDQVISPQITLWNQQGSEVIQGTLLVIPIEESLLYIRPLYLRAAGGKIPELKRVIVAYQNQIVMEETLDRAIDRIFRPGAARAEPAAAGTPSGTAGATERPAPASVDELAAQARVHFERALEAQRNGDWAKYGEEIAKVGELLGRMSRGR